MWGSGSAGTACALAALLLGNAPFWQVRFSTTWAVAVRPVLKHGDRLAPAVSDCMTENGPTEPIFLLEASLSLLMVLRLCCLPGWICCQLCEQVIRHSLLRECKVPFHLMCNVQLQAAPAFWRLIGDVLTLWPHQLINDVRKTSPYASAMCIDPNQPVACDCIQVTCYPCTLAERTCVQITTCVLGPSTHSCRLMADERT